MKNIYSQLNSDQQKKVDDYYMANFAKHNEDEAGLERWLWDISEERKQEILSEQNIKEIIK